MRTRYVVVSNRRNYGCFAFLLDLFLIIITSGLWIVWIIIRQMKGRN